ncbi:MAG: S-methyl-5-thioribose-1-phosphate isomerase [Candidatus Diapherotrites archaeon]|nr:S-methyl-5-thioribose-1-phosphate isomerase [Candidatus Diapherotrites archaeon]
MLSKKFLKTVKDIKSLKIQGASNVRKAAVEALLEEVNEFNDSSILHFKADLFKSVKELINARPTEPELRSALRIVLHTAQSNSHSLFDLKKEVKNSLGYFEKQRNEGLRKIATYGAREIPNDAIVMTHCHSHTVMEILKEAHKQGKIERVICTESRPLFQGRKTAEELTKAGVKTTMIVDSAVSSIVKECGLFLSGADAVLSDGSVVNKIGTQNVSMLAEKFGVPHYVACGTAKFDPVTFFGFQEIIEQRAPEEVWDKKLKNFEIKNPAFDITAAKYVKALITEKGVFPPTEFAGMMYKDLQLEKHEKEFLSLISLMKK